MSARVPESARLIPVPRIRPGDHAFVAYDNDEARWDAPCAFTRLGLAGGEKVMVLAAPGLSEDEVLTGLDLRGPVVEESRARGRLVFSSMRELILPSRKFTPERQMSRLREETDRAVDEGFTGLRTYIDMHWVPELNAGIETMMHRETHADHLFAGRPYTEICAYDRRLFDRDVLDAMAKAHPRCLLARLGALQAVHDEATLILVGEADLVTREEFRAALDKSLLQVVGYHPDLTVDLTRLHFLGVAPASDLLGVCRGPFGNLRFHVHCSPSQANVLRKLGAEYVSRLILTEVRP